MRNIIESTENYENWLDKQTRLVREDLELKHWKMAEDPFQFLRATFYRWCERWPQVCPKLAGATRVLGVGDLHVQNFGTWRDNEGRLVWGVNDFDEAELCSFANDLVRTAVSAQLVAKQNEMLKLSRREVLESLWNGYVRAVETRGRPFVLDRRHPWLLQLARSALKEPKQFWKTWLNEKTEPVENSGTVPKDAQEALIAPPFPTKEGVEFRWKKKDSDPKGLGSLGRMRFFALVDWLGGPVAREAKACALSSWLWAEGKSTGENRIAELLKKGVRSPDPFVSIQDNWLVRPIAADCGRIDLDQLEACGSDKDRYTDQMKLLRAMGFETANIHLGSTTAYELEDALKSFTLDEFKRATQQMLQVVEEDFAVWQKHWEKNGWP
jgi:Uncharacterized protein conserved in bacteria (DUF2252)